MAELDTLVSVGWWAILPLIAVGSALHFVFDWTGHNRVVAIVAAVNESYWEHIKIAAWPTMVLYVVLFAFGGHRYPSFVPAATVALYSIPVTMIGVVYAYKAVSRRNVLWLDISVFALTIALAQALFVSVLEGLRASPLLVALSVFYLVGIVAAYVLFTLRPPREPDVFIDPFTAKYGIEGHAGLEADPRK
jgi:pheromone shutdown protein TraB